MGLKPVFVDINLKDLSFDYDQIKEKITDRTRAIFVTHLIGFPADMEKIKAIAKGRDIQIMEDCCESHGAKINEIKVGNFGVGSTFSFYWGHHMTTVEGGMICTDSEKLHKLCLLKRSHGLARELPEQDHEFYRKQYPEINFNFLFLTDGFNFRNTELHAVLGLSQIEKLEDYIKIRNKNYGNFVDMCKKHKKFFHIFELDGISSFCLPFVFKDTEMKRKFQEKLTEDGIESRPMISGNLLNQPFLKNHGNPSDFKNAELIDKNAFYIGNNQFVNEKRLDALKEIMAGFF
jgi:CDP-6-deoxy-D-xylo-4-hexulose-3-dehydrase